MELNAARIFVRDIEQARDFYLQLGMSLESYHAEQGICIFDAGNIRLIIESVAMNAPEDEQILVGRYTGLSLSTEDISMKYQQLIESGVEFIAEPQQQYWGGWLATFVDSAGNQIQLVQEPA